MAEYELTWHPGTGLDDRTPSTLILDIETAIDEFGAVTQGFDYGGTVQSADPLSARTQWKFFAVAETEADIHEVAGCIEQVLSAATGASEKLVVHNLDARDKERDQMDQAFRVAYDDIISGLRRRLVHAFEPDDFDLVTYSPDPTRDDATWWASLRLDVPEARLQCRIGVTRPTAPVWPPMIPHPRPTTAVQWGALIEDVDAPVGERTETVVRSQDINELLDIAATVILSRV